MSPQTVLDGTFVAPLYGLDKMFCASLLSFAFFSALLPLLGPFRYHFGFILEPLGPQKHSIFIEMVIKFKLFASFAFGIAWGQENQPKTVQITPPGRPKGPPEEPRSAQESPRRAPRASRNHPQRALRVPLGVQKVSWGGFGSLRASFWSPQGYFYLFFITFPDLLFSLLFSLLSLFPHVCYYFHPLFSLLCALVSLLFSLFSLVFPAARRLSRSELGSAAPCLAGEQGV